MIQAGDMIPDVTVQAGPGEDVRLRELVAEGPVLLVFYLFDWSSTCTNELEVLATKKPELAQAGVRAYGISRDSPWTHISWMQALDLDIPLLSDWNGDATRGFGIAREFRGLRDVAERTAFLVDRDGTVRGAWHYDTGHVPSFDEPVAAVSALAAS